MGCKVSVTNVDQTTFPFQPPNKGGKVFGSATFKVSCEEKRTNPELRIDEDLSFLAKLIGKEVYSRSPRVLDANGKEQGLATIEGSSQVDRQTVSVAFNVTTGANGKQTFDIKLKCRCKPTDNWTPVSVDVSISI